jgi:hypothetical protein
MLKKNSNTKLKRLEEIANLELIQPQQRFKNKIIQQRERGERKGWLPE